MGRGVEALSHLSSKSKRSFLHISARKWQGNIGYAFLTYFYFYLPLKGKGLFCREAFWVDSLAREDARQDLFPPPIPAALLGTWLSQPRAKTIPGSQGRAACRGQLPGLPSSDRSHQPSATSGTVTPSSHGGFPAPSKS